LNQKVRPEVAGPDDGLREIRERPRNPYFRIFKRTGHSGWWALLMFVPVANIITLYIIAFNRWPTFEGRSES
jgi:hypothetical protein